MPVQKDGKIEQRRIQVEGELTRPKGEEGCAGETPIDPISNLAHNVDFEEK
jgi:hypothetical protein